MHFGPAVSNASTVDLPERFASPALLPFGSAAPSVARFSTDLLVGAGPILAIRQELDELRTRCDQQDDMTTNVDYFLSYMDPRNCRPVVLTFRSESRLEAAVFFHQVCFVWVGTGLGCAGDPVGDGLLITPAHEREDFLRRAMEELVCVQKKFHTIRLLVKSSRSARLVDFERSGVRSKIIERTVKHRLALAESYEEMMASFGLRTRRSLRTKRRQLEEILRPEFLPRLGPEESFEGMCYLRARSSLPARSMWYFEGRRRILHAHPDAFAMALRSPDGAWLSILSGWRRNGTTYVDVQLNHAGYARESLSAVMRAFLLEHEIGIGQKYIVFVGGCSALLERYCNPSESVVDLLVTRYSIRAWWFKKAIRVLCDSSFEQWIYM
jgi:hypothetical protein